ncbi:MAG: hypothetical protein Rubg2KO_25580 [Rubricoccaceae bacterium]
MDEMAIPDNRDAKNGAHRIQPEEKVGEDPCFKVCVISPHSKDHVALDNERLFGIEREPAVDALELEMTAARYRRRDARIDHGAIVTNDNQSREGCNGRRQGAPTECMESRFCKMREQLIIVIKHGNPAPFGCTNSCVPGSRGS